VTIIYCKYRSLIASQLDPTTIILDGCRIQHCGNVNEPMLDPGFSRTCSPYNSTSGGVNANGLLSTVGSLQIDYKESLVFFHDWNRHQVELDACRY
jgi:hypothetical protein